MTEQDPAERLTPAQAEAVRRLLAAARHDEGIPDEVAARLDSTITDLAAERVEAAAGNDETPGAGEALVIPFRRRRWPQVLVAAAAVTVFGFGMAQIVGGDSDGDAGTSSDDNAAQPEVATSEDFGSDGAGDDTSPGSAGPPRDAVGNLTGESLKLDQESLSRLGIKGLRQLTRGALASDLDELLADSATEGSRDTPSGYDARAVAGQCGPYYSVTGGEIFAASYRRHLALVLFHPKLDGVRLVEIYDCESATPRHTVRTVTLKTGE